VSKWPKVGQNLRGSIAVAFPSVAKSIKENGQEAVGLRSEDSRLILQDQTLDKMAEG